MKKRWQLRFQSFEKAYKRFSVLASIDFDQASDIEKEALIKRFEYTYELSKNLLKDYLMDQDNISKFSAKDIVRYAYRNGYISDGQLWIDAVDYRNKTIHTYHPRILDQTVCFAQEKFLPMLKELYIFFQDKM